MNDDGRVVLIDAALRRHQQIRGVFHDEGLTGDCALGVLHLQCHESRKIAQHCANMARGIFAIKEIKDRFAVSAEEISDIVDRNDRGDDFITIARKVGVPQESQ